MKKIFCLLLVWLIILLSSNIYSKSQIKYVSQKNYFWPFKAPIITKVDQDEFADYYRISDFFLLKGGAKYHLRSLDLDSEEKQLLNDVEKSLGGYKFFSTLSIATFCIGWGFMAYAGTSDSYSGPGSDWSRESIMFVLGVVFAYLPFHWISLATLNKAESYIKRISEHYNARNTATLKDNKNYFAFKIKPSFYLNKLNDNYQIGLGTSF